MLARRVGEFLRVWASSASKSTCRTYQYHLDRLVGFVGRRKLTSLVCADFFTSLRSQYSENTVHQAWRTLQTFFKYGVSQKWWVQSPLVGLKPPPEPEPARVGASWDVCLKFLAYVEARPRDLAVVVVLSDTNDLEDLSASGAGAHCQRTCTPVTVSAMEAGLV